MNRNKEELLTCLERCYKGYFLDGGEDCSDNGCEYGGSCEKVLEDAIELLKDQPEVVRCRDCDLNSGTPHNPLCRKDCNAHYPDWFCADGERKK